MPEPGEITVLLRRWRSGDEAALNQLVPHVYSHLHEVAAIYLRHESPGHTLQPTALVHELYLKLLRQRKAEWEDRGHFYAFAAKMMRRILIDHARAVCAGKRGSGGVLPLNEEIPWVDLNSTDVIEINRALDELEAVDPRKVSLAELRYFLGCTVAEASTILGISTATADRDLALLRSWLRSRLTGSKQESPADEELHEKT